MRGTLAKPAPTAPRRPREVPLRRTAPRHGRVNWVARNAKSRMANAEHQKINVNQATSSTLIIMHTPHQQPNVVGTRLRRTIQTINNRTDAPVRIASETNGTTTWPRRSIFIGFISHKAPPYIPQHSGDLFYCILWMGSNSVV